MDLNELDDHKRVPLLETIDFQLNEALQKCNDFGRYQIQNLVLFCLIWITTPNNSNNVTLLSNYSKFLL